MLKLFSTIAPAVALVLVAVLLLEPPALTPGERVPTLRLLSGAVSRRAPNAADPDRWQGFLGEWQVDRNAVGSSPFDESVHPYRIHIATRRDESTGNPELVITEAFLSTSRTETYLVETATNRFRDEPEGVVFEMTVREPGARDDIVSTRRYTVETDRRYLSRSQARDERVTRLVFERMVEDRR